MVKTIKKSIRMLVQTLDHIEDKRSKTLDLMMDKQLNYFKMRNKVLNDTETTMVNVIVGLSNVLSMALARGKNKANNNVHMVHEEQFNNIESSPTLT